MITQRILMGLVGIVVFFGGGVFAGDAPRRNVLLVMADDFRDYGGVFTRGVVKTPNLDRLRARGVTFERAYVQYPVCNPSRCSMLTGLRPEQTGIVSNTVPMREALPEVVTLPQLCRQNGWRTAAFGKIFHIGGNDETSRRLWFDAEKSWDESQAFKATELGRKMIGGRNLTGGKLKWCEWGMAEGGDDDQPDGQIASATIAAIEKYGEQPWFIGCGFMKPHDPFIAPKKYFDLYPPEALSVWRDPKEMTPAPAHAVGFGATGEAFAQFTDSERMEFLRAYCAGTSFMDAQLGRVLDVLDKRQLWEKTLVIFVGDHGYHTGERGWWNKDTLFERACRAPFILAAPDAKGGQASRSIIEFVDLYPTVAEFCGLKNPAALAGSSLWPVLRDPSKSVKDAAYTLVMRGAKVSGKSVKVERWRFTRWSTGETELHDHSVDPEETQNVSAGNPDVVRELGGRLDGVGKGGK